MTYIPEKYCPFMKMGNCSTNCSLYIADIKQCSFIDMAYSLGVISETVQTVMDKFIEKRLINNGRN